MESKRLENIPQCPFFDPATWFCTARHTFHYETYRPYCTRCNYFEKTTQQERKRQVYRKAG